MIKKVRKFFVAIANAIPGPVIRYWFLVSHKFLVLRNDDSLQSKFNEYTLRKLYPLEEGELCIICSFGIGDTVMAAGLVHKIKEKHGIKKVALLVKSHHHFAAAAFPSVDRIILRNDSTKFVSWGRDIFVRDQGLAPGNYFLAHFEDRTMQQLIGYKGITLFDCYKALFKIDFSSELQAPRQLVQDAKDYCDELFKTHNLTPGKTILLAIDANSIKPLPVEFWIPACEILKTRGYDIVLNAKQGSEILSPYATYIEIPLDYVACFVVAAGRAISLRNGLCDLLALYNVNLTVLYPAIEWYHGTMKQGAGIMKKTGANNVTEIEVDAEGGDAADFFAYLNLL